MALELGEDERAALAELLRETIGASQYPLSPRIKTLKASVYARLGAENNARYVI